MEARKKKDQVPNMINEDHKPLKINTPIFRLSYPTLGTPRAYQNKGKKYFSIEMLFAKDSDELASFKKEIEKVAIDAFGKDRKKWPKELVWPMFDGEDKQDSVGYNGQMFFKAKTEESKRPVLYKRDMTPAIDSDFYGGCFCDAIVNAKAVYLDGEHYITLYLGAVRFVKAGTPFGGGVSASDFRALEDDGEESQEQDENSEESESESYW